MVNELLMKTVCVYNEARISISVNMCFVCFNYAFYQSKDEPTDPRGFQFVFSFSFSFICV